ncbi:MAG: hypothetical protein FJ100_17210 [Deltaproteobacteria bacterium]|nr:hypothetical protein [Deltaproteobacteria bacterium]
MEALLKRHFWAVVLLGLGLLGYLGAGTIGAIVGVQLAKASRGDDKVRVAAAAGESPLSKRLRDGRLRTESGAVMAGRSMFLLEEPPPQPEEPVEEEKPEEPAAGAPPEPSYEPTTLPIKLMGTLVVSPESWSSASVEVDRQSQKIVSVGTELLDGKAKVEMIRRTCLVLNEGAKLTKACMFQPEGGQVAGGPEGANPGARPAMPERPNPTPAPSPRATAEADNVPGVKKLGEGAYNLDRSHVNDKLKDVSQLGLQVRVVPNYKSGKYEGFRMIGMGGDSLFKDIGFINGDIVQAINGERIDSPNKALALYEALKNKARVTVLIERDGQPKTLRYTIK